MIENKILMILAGVIEIKSLIVFVSLIAIAFTINASNKEIKKYQNRRNEKTIQKNKTKSGANR